MHHVPTGDSVVIGAYLAAITAVLIGNLVIGQMALAPIGAEVLGLRAPRMPNFYQRAMDFVAAFKPYRTPRHRMMASVVGTLTILLLGMGVSHFSSRRPRPSRAS